MSKRGQVAATWIDLLDPTADEVREKAPKQLEDSAIERLLAPPEHEDEPRPTLQGHGDYVFGVLLVAVAVPDEDDVFYQEIDLIITHDTLLTVRKTPQGNRAACDVDIVKKTVKPTDSAGMMAYRLVDRSRSATSTSSTRSTRRSTSSRTRSRTRRRKRHADASRHFATTCCTSDERSHRCAMPYGA